MLTRTLDLIDYLNYILDVELIRATAGFAGKPKDAYWDAVKQVAAENGVTVEAVLAAVHYDGVPPAAPDGFREFLAAHYKALYGKDIPAYLWEAAS